MSPRLVVRTLALAAAAAVFLLAVSWRWPAAAERAAAPIVERNAAARGGLDAWRAVKAMSLSGRLEAGTPRDPRELARQYQRSLSQLKADARLAAAHPEKVGRARQVELPYVMELKRPRMSRVEVVFRGQTAVQVFDGTRGWKLRPYLGRQEVEPFTAEELGLAAQQAALDGPLMDAAATHASIALVGTEKVDGRDAYKLEVKARDGQLRHVWVDVQTFLDVKVDGTRRLAGRDRAVWTRFGDFRRVDGLLVPHLLETGMAGLQGTEKIVVEHVALNPPLADGLFSRPD